MATPSTAPAGDVIYVLPDKLGGVFTICRNLLEYRDRGGLPHGVVLTHNRWGEDVRSDRSLPADWVTVVDDMLPAENLYAALRRLRQALRGPGALVANDLIELATASAFPHERTVYSIVHGDWDYYYDLAARHDADVDVFITYSETMNRKLRARLPHREADILLLRTGVHIGAHRPARRGGRLRVLFAGRMNHAHKGIFDLPQMAARLRDMGVDVAWTVVGDGPDYGALRDAWTDPGVRWRGALSAADAVAELPQHDVFVMPSRFEGLPSALLEAGAAGLVPVASRIASGIPEVVIDGENGWLAPPGDVDAFSAAIARLDRDRDGFEAMSGAIRARVERLWNIERNAREYQRHVERWREWRRPARVRRPVPYGSRLDQRWLPNPIVKAVRRFTWHRPESVRP